MATFVQTLFLNNSVQSPNANYFCGQDDDWVKNPTYRPYKFLTPETSTIFSSVGWAIHISWCWPKCCLSGLLTWAAGMLPLHRQTCNLVCTDLILNPDRTRKIGQFDRLHGSKSPAEKLGINSHSSPAVKLKLLHLFQFVVDCCGFVAQQSTTNRNKWS